MSKKKRAYEKPALRKVRLEVKTSVLAVCHTSTVATPNNPSCQVVTCVFP